VVLGQNDTVINLGISPNPASDHFLLHTTDLKKYTIYDAKGQQIVAQEVEHDQIIIQTSTWQSGIYFIQTTHGDGSMRIKKLIVAH
jgi:hypothetical protein